MWITWTHNDASLSWPLTFEKKVELFYEQALGWQLHVADLVANGGTAFGEEGQREGKAAVSIRHSGFAVLQICLSYFETIGCYTGAPSGSKASFKAGVAKVFPELAAQDPVAVQGFIDALYHGARCGLYHNTRTAKVGLGAPPDDVAIVYDHSADRMVISPERLPKVLKAHLESYRNALMEEANRELRQTFEKRFDQDSGAA